MLAVVLLGGGRPAAAVEVIAGRVVAVDREQGRLVLAPLDDRQPQQVIEFAQGRLPADLQAGEIVRIKGDFSRRNDGVLASKKIWCSCPVRRGWDRTGVRRRLFEGRGPGFGRGGRGGHGGRGKH